MHGTRYRLLAWTPHACFTLSLSPLNCAGDFEGVLKSIAWQSPTLTNFLRQQAPPNSRLSTNFEYNEQLSEADIAELLAGAGQGPAMSLRTASSPGTLSVNRLSIQSPRHTVCIGEIRQALDPVALGEHTVWADSCTHR